MGFYNIKTLRQTASREKDKVKDNSDGGAHFTLHCHPETCKLF